MENGLHMVGEGVVLDEGVVHCGGFCEIGFEVWMEMGWWIDRIDGAISHVKESRDMQERTAQVRLTLIKKY